MYFFSESFTVSGSFVVCVECAVCDASRACCSVAFSVLDFALKAVKMLGREDLGNKDGIVSSCEEVIMLVYFCSTCLRTAIVIFANVSGVSFALRTSRWTRATIGV